MSATAIRSRDDALEFLHGRIDYERALSIPGGGKVFKLDRMRELLTRLRNPQDGLLIVHIAGTKGKGSTAAAVAAILRAAGLSTGLFTSPHLERVEERLVVDGRPVEDAELAALVERVRPIVAAMDAEGPAFDPPRTGPTYFELLTAIGLLHFVGRRVDAAVLEVGVGGRLDSTNVCRPAMSAITSISFDHEELLGDTLEAIAAEKAGIIKPGVPVVSGVRSGEARAAIEQVAAECGSRLVQLGRDFDFEYRPPRRFDEGPPQATFSFRRLGGQGELIFADVPLSLLGRHQAANAAVAVAACLELADRLPVTESAIREGLASLAWPARIEVVARRPTTILDAAHNVASAAALAETLEESFEVDGRRILIFAATLGKDTAGMLRELLPKFDIAIFTRYTTNPRGVPPNELAATGREISQADIRVAANPLTALELARSLAGPEDLICVTGSFFIAGELRGQFR